MTQRREAATSNGFARRRAATRTALVRAGRQLLADGHSEQASIQKITDTAGVGFGSFHNHFSSKDELFEAAVHQILKEYAALLEGATAALADPAEKFAAKLRLTFRLIDRQPVLVQVLARRGHLGVQADTGLGPNALLDIDAAAHGGRFAVQDPRTALYAVSGALLGLIQLTLETPERAAVPQFAEGGTEMLLRMLGMDAAEAHELARRPLPPLPSTHETNVVHEKR